MTIPCGGGSVIPMTTAVASPSWIASTAIFAAMPNEAHAATGAKAGPLILPIIDTCAAGMFAMFHSSFGETDAHGSAGQPHFLFRARTPFSFCRIIESLAEPDDGGTGPSLIAAASAKYSRSASLFAAQYDSDSCLPSIQASEPNGSVDGSAGACSSVAPSRCCRRAAQRSGAAQNS